MKFKLAITVLFVGIFAISVYAAKSANIEPVDVTTMEMLKGGCYATVKSTPVDPGYPSCPKTCFGIKSCGTATAGPGSNGKCGRSKTKTQEKVVDFAAPSGIPEYREEGCGLCLVFVCTGGIIGAIVEIGELTECVLGPTSC